MIDKNNTLISIQEFINASLKEVQDNRPVKKITSWYASQIGSCMRGMYLQRLGKEPDEPLDDRTLRVFDMGNKIESWVVDLIKAQEVEIETQVRVEDAELNITGYADAVIEVKGKKEVLEIKSKHSRAFWWMDKKKEGTMRQHQYQLWIYLYLLKIDRGSIIYVSKDDLSILQYLVFRNDKQLEKEVMEIINSLNRAWKKQDPSLLPLPEKGSWQAKYCRYHKQCLKYEPRL